MKEKWPLKLLMVPLFVGLIVSGCGTKETINQPSNSPDTLQQAQQPESVAVNPVAIEFKVHSEILKEKDGTPLLNLKITYPQLKNPANEPGISAINQYYDRQYEQFLSNMLGKGLEMAREDKKSAEQNGYEFRPHTYDRSTKINYNGNHLLSVLNVEYENTGGAHPNTVWLSETFDVKTGKKLALSDLLGGTQEEALAKVYQTVLEQIKKTEGTDKFIYQEGYSENLRNYYAADDFVLTENNLLIYYQLYALAAYAAGFPTFEIPYNQLKAPAMTIPPLKENQPDQELYAQAAGLIDRNKEAFMSKEAGGGYNVNWNDYRFEISAITETSANLRIFTTDDSPAGKTDISLTAQLSKENNSWLLAKMLH